MISAEFAAYATGPFLAACALLVAAGVTKWREPRRMQALGLAEVAVGIAGAITGRAGALVVAAVYVALAAYAFRLLVVAPERPCHCLGATPAPVTAGHVALDLGAALCAFVAAFGPSPFAVMTSLPFGGVPFVVLVACCAWLGALVLGAYPELRTAQRERKS